MKYLILALIPFLIFSCAGNDHSDSENEIETIGDKYFPQFPSKQFHDVIFGRSFTEAESALKDHGYSSKDEQPNHFVNDNLQTEVILCENDLLQEFKVFFFNQEDLKSADEFRALFSKHANEEFPSPEFCVYNFNYLSKAFSVTLFEQPDFIRLNFELKSAP